MSIRYTKGYRYALVEDYSTVVDIGATAECDYLALRNGMLRIKAGYSWDGASGPAIDTKDFMRGSLVHDALYQLIGMSLINKSYRKAADNELRRICREDGMTWIRSQYVYRAVRMFGGSHVLPEGRREVKKAP